MKPRLLSTARLSFPLAAAIAALLGAPSAQANNYYWDIDGATAGAGSATPSGTWSNGGTTWSTSSTGSGATSGYTTLATDDLFLSAGTNATGAYTITLSGTVSAKSLTFEEGTATLTGASSVLSLGGTGNITVNSGLSAIIGNGSSLRIGASTAGLTKLGAGTLTLSNYSQNSFTGGVRLNGGILAIDYSVLPGGSITADMIVSTNSLTLNGGSLSVKAKTAGTFSQAFNGTTVSAGGGQILGDKNGSTSLTLSLGALTTTAAGGSLLVGAGGTGANAPIITTTTNKDGTGIYGGRVVFYNGTANTGYDWATTVTGSSPYTLSGLATGSYSTMVVGATSDTLNTRVAGAGITLTGAHTHNSLKLEASSGTLALGANLLTLTNGGLLVTGTTATAISGTAGATRLTGSASGDLIIHQFNSGGLNISAVIGDNGGATSLTKAGTQTLTLSGANTYTGSTYINAGTLQLGSGSTTGTLSTSSAIVDTGTFTINRSNAVVQGTDFSNNISGIGGLTQAGAGTLTLSSPTNTYTGETAIGGGTLRLANTAAVQNSRGVRFSASSTILQLGTDTAFSSLPKLTGGYSSTTNLTMVSDRATSGAGLTHALGVADFGNTTFNVTKGTNVTSGTAGISFASMLMGGGSTGTVTLNPTTANLIITGNATGSNTGTGTLALDGTSTGNSIGGAIENGTRTTQNLIKSNTGTWTLSGTNTYNGTTTISAGTLQLGNGGTTGKLSTSSAITNNGTFVINRSNAVAQGTDFSSAAITGTGGLTQAGSGTTTLNVANTFTGTTTISAGALKLGNANAVQKSTVSIGVANGLTFAGSIGTFNLGGLSGASDESLMDANAQGVTISVGANNADTTYSGNLSDDGATTDGALTKVGTGTLTISGTGSYWGATTITNGTLRLTGSLTGGGDISTSGTGILDESAAGVISDTASITQGSSGTSILSGLNSYTGATTINAGVLSINSIANKSGGNSAIGNPTTNTTARIIMGSGANTGTLIYTGGIQSTDRNIAIGSNSGTGADTGGATIQNDGSGLLTFSNTTAFNLALSGASANRILTLQGANGGVISGPIANNNASALVALTKAGNGTWTLNGTNTYSGNTTITGGNLQIDSTGTLGSGNYAGAIAISTGALLQYSSSANQILSGTVTGLGGLTKDTSSASTLTLTNGGNTYSGTTAISAGTLHLGNANAVQNSTVSIGVTDGLTFAESIGIFNLGGLSGASDLLLDDGAAGVTISVGGNNADTTYSGALSDVAGGGALTKVGSGTLTLSGSSSYTGATSISAGTLSLTGSLTGDTAISTSGTGILNQSAAGVISGAASVTQGSSGTSILAGSNTYTGTTTVTAGTLSFTGSLSGDGDILVSGGTLSLTGSLTGGGNIDTSGSGILNQSAGGVISGASIVTQGSSGTSVLAGSNSYTGDTIISDGTLSLTGSLSGGTAISTSGTGLLNQSAAGVISGAASVTQGSSGTSVLTGTNTYTGATTVTAGKLLINGSISTSVLTTVSSGATLGGSGIVGALTIDSGGFVTPGNSPGILTVNGDYSQAGEYTAEIAGTTAGSQYDQIGVTGAVDITGGSLVALFSSGSYALGDKLFILLNDGFDAITGTYSGFAQGATVATYGGFDWAISYLADSTGNTFTGGNDIALMAVPEPNIAALIGGFGVLALLRRRR